MIIGVGTDIVQIPRIERILSIYNNRFIRKCLSKVELERFALLNKQHHASFLAKRFAGKEAISKAFGTGIRQGLRFKDIVILNDNFGKPVVQIISESLDQYKQFKIHLSLSDDYPTSIAFAVISL